MEDDNHNNNTPSASSPPAPPQAEASSRMQMHPKSPLAQMEVPLLCSHRDDGDVSVFRGDVKTNEGDEK